MPDYKIDSVLRVCVKNSITEAINSVQDGRTYLQRNNNNMLLLEKIIGVFAPHVCLGCATEENRLVCLSCRAALAHVPSRCYRCHAVTRDFAVCMLCRRYTPLRCVLVSTHYDDLPKELLHHTKYERARSGIGEMAELMVPLLRFVPPGALFVAVPTATSRVRQRGYDQAALLANELCVSLGSAKRDVLARVGQAHQVGAGRKERLEHLQGAFRVTRPKEVAGKHIILVDDVLTTGATLETAARVLKQSGAKRVDAIVFSQAG